MRPKTMVNSNERRGFFATSRPQWKGRTRAGSLSEVGNACAARSGLLVGLRRRKDRVVGGLQMAKRLRAKTV